MHWVIQNNLFSEKAIECLVEYLKRYEIPHDVIKVIPFAGGIEPEVNPSNPVVVIGSYSLSRYAMRKGWTPGSWMGQIDGVDNFSFDVCCKHHGAAMLNYGARVVAFKDVLSCEMDRFFIRPVNDGKIFTGTTMDREKFSEWQNKIAGADSTWTITPDTEVVVGPTHDIISETRFVVSDGRIVTGSEYRRAGRVLYNPVVDPHVIEYAHQAASLWTPDRICVMDIADTPDGCRIVEFNNFNSAGWYECDVSKIIQEVECFR